MSNMVNIDVMRSQQDTARAYKWDVFLSGPGPGGATTINLRCASVDQPTPTYENIDVNIRAFTKKESGAVTWNELNFTIIEVVSHEVLQTLWNWGQKQFNNRSGVQLNKSGYEGEARIQLLNLQDAVVRTWHLKGVVLGNVNAPQLTSDKATAVETSFTCSYDYADLL